MSEKIQQKHYQDFTWTDILSPSQSTLNKVALEHNLDLFQISDSIEKGHLPKLEKQNNYNFIILRAFTSSIEQDGTSIQELSNKVAFFYNEEKIITIHQSSFDFLPSFQHNFKSTEEILLFIIYQMIETYAPPLKSLDEEIERIEEKVFLRENTKVSLEDVYFLKIQTRITKKLLQLFQNVIQQIEVAPKHKTALQDMKDKLVSHLLSYDEMLENVNNLLHTYLSINAQKSNDVMKLLTIFSAFFLPLTFIAGIYGMNFQFMPELTHKFGYFITLAAMGIIAVVIYAWFKRKRIL